MKRLLLLTLLLAGCTVANDSKEVHAAWVEAGEVHAKEVKLGRR